MQLCNDTITLYNRRFDPDEDCDVYERTVIRGVHWFNSEATTVDSTGLKAANKVTIRIPTDADFGGKVYLPPKQYVHYTGIKTKGTFNPTTKAFTASE